MPNKSKGNKSASQVKRLNNNANARREYNEYVRQLERSKKAEIKSREKKLKAILKSARETGLYNPKSDELTKYRKSKLREIEKQYGAYLDKDKYFFLPAGKNARKKIIERANSLQIPSSRTGLFFPKEGHKTAKLKEDKKRKEFYVERRGKTKSGVNKGRVYKDVTPLTSLDQLDAEQNRLRKMAAKFGPLKEGERLVFKVVENGVEGYSHATFTNIELLIKYLDRYPKSVAARVNFYRHIKVEKSSVNEWFARHKPRSPGKAGRKKIFDTRRSKG